MSSMPNCSRVVSSLIVPFSTQAPYSIDRMLLRTDATYESSWMSP